MVTVVRLPRSCSLGLVSCFSLEPSSERILPIIIGVATYLHAVVSLQVVRVCVCESIIILLVGGSPDMKPSQSWRSIPSKPCFKTAEVSPVPRLNRVSFPSAFCSSFIISFLFIELQTFTDNIVRVSHLHFFCPMSVVFGKKIIVCFNIAFFKREKN